jgi:glutathione S-transferase
MTMKLYSIPGASSLFQHVTLREAGSHFELIKVDEHTKLMARGEDYRAIKSLRAGA